MKEAVQGFWSYTEQTPFHGFGFANKGWGKCEIATWLMAVGVCIAIAIQQTIALVQIYQSEPTVTEVSSVFNQTYLIPNPTLCIDVSYKNLIPPDPKAWIVGMANSGGNINNLLAKLQNYTGEQIYADNNAKDLLKLMYLMFAEITKYDVAFIAVGLMPPVTWNIPTSPQTHKFLTSSNRSFSDLLKLTGSMLCKLTNLKVTFTYLDRILTYQPIFQQFDVCQIDRVTHLDDQVFCVKVLGNGEQISYMGPTDILMITLDPEMWNPDEGTKNQFSIDLASRAFFNKYSDNGNVYQSEYYTNTRVSVQLLNEFNRLNLKRRPCLDMYSQFDCGRLCGGRYIQKVCGCWPVYMFDLKPQNISLCAASLNNLKNSTLMPDYHVCMAAINPKNATRMPPGCLSGCPGSCKYQQFMFFMDSKTQLNTQPSIPVQQPTCCQNQSQPQIQQQNQSQPQLQHQQQKKESQPKPSSTMFDLTIRDFTYTQVDESVVKDWQSFMNEFGGSIGVWLGGSILALIHLPVYCAKMVVAGVKGKKAKPKTFVMENDIYTNSNPTQVPITF